ncbi:hypothetical protein ABW20_dc0100762 [Dactylellina cionopaga]|nr:hypothetical protein ABW20_dc0100762 [Dactylellina cionopaga]
MITDKSFRPPGYATNIYFKTAIQTVRPCVDEHGLLGSSKSAGHVLDYGCGDGRATTALAPYSSKITGVDKDPKAVEKYNTIHNSYSGGRISAVTALDPNIQYDTIMIRLVAHGHDGLENFAHLWPSLKPDGCFIISDNVHSEEVFPETDSCGGKCNLGFSETTVKDFYRKCGFENIRWEISNAPREYGWPDQFVAWGQKPSEAL